jgi:hypothetical protein
MSQFDVSARTEEAKPWRWRLEDASGAEVAAPAGLADQAFPSQADAESWIGEFWPELADAGVAAVTLFEADREVYGPMSLEA